MDYNYLPLDSTPINLNQLRMLLQYKQHISITFQAWEAVENCRHYLDKKLADEPGVMHGLFNSLTYLQHVPHEEDKPEQMQYNLLKSHSQGSGEEVPIEIAKLMVALKVKSLSYGLSGVQNTTIQRLMDMHNNDVIPVVHTQNDSDTFSEMRFLCQPVIGLGEVWYQGEKRNTKAVEEELGWKQVHLKSPEAIALLTGTQYLLSYGIWCLIKATHLLDMAEVIAAISSDAGGRHGATDAFHSTPQVQSTTRNTLSMAAEVLITEVNSATEDINIFREEDLIQSGTNHNYEAIALAVDNIKNALNKLAECSVQRIQLLEGNKQQYSIQEKHEIAGNHIATKCFQAVENVENVLAYELISAVRLQDRKSTQHSSDSIEKLVAALKKEVDIYKDEILTLEIMNKAIAFISRWKIK